MDNRYRRLSVAAFVLACGAFGSRTAAAQSAFPAMEAVEDPSDPGDGCPTCLTTSTPATLTFKLNQTTVIANKPPPGAQVTSLYLTALNGNNLAFNHLVLTHGSSSTDVFTAFANGTNWYPTAQFQMTFPFAGLPFDGPWGMTVVETAVGSNPQLTVTMVVNWQMPAPPAPPPPGPVSVQGYKLDINDQVFNGPVITVDGNSTGSGNPYGIQVQPNQVATATSSVPAGYWVAHSLCLACTNHPDASFAYGNAVSAFLEPGQYMDLWWKYVAVSKGYLDTSVSSDGNFSGWAYDPFASAISINVDIYMDGPAGQGTFIARVNANGSRPDVDAVFGITGNHGFSVALPAQYLGSNHRVYVYAIGVNGHDNPLIANTPGAYDVPAPPAPPPPPPPVCRPGYHDCGDGICVKPPAVCQ
jgi:hypothetical protein